MIRRDMPRVLDIERASFEFPWSEDDFMVCLKQRNCIGMVALCEDLVVGSMIYELHKERLHLLNLAVDPACRRNGVGSRLIDKLIGKLSQQRRFAITVEVRESNLTAQMFFRQHGFKAVLVLRQHYLESDEDAYLMRFVLGHTA